MGTVTVAISVLTIKSIVSTPLSAAFEFLMSQQNTSVDNVSVHITASCARVDVTTSFEVKLTLVDALKVPLSGLLAGAHAIVECLRKLRDRGFRRGVHELVLFDVVNQGMGENELEGMSAELGTVAGVSPDGKDGLELVLVGIQRGVRHEGAKSIDVSEASVGGGMSMEDHNVVTRDDVFGIGVAKLGRRSGGYHRSGDDERKQEKSVHFHSDWSDETNTKCFRCFLGL
mmetsp:Transcript_15100/g.38300  ORF Transcript_15100/g.38300 Transcript_15100/m.38300 type:complete len:229 (+) Transcript_15100:720-1406(+)